MWCCVCVWVCFNKQTNIYTQVSQPIDAVDSFRERKKKQKLIITWLTWMELFIMEIIDQVKKKKFLTEKNNWVDILRITSIDWCSFSLKPNSFQLYFRLCFLRWLNFKIVNNKYTTYSPHIYVKRSLVITCISDMRRQQQQQR